MKFFSRKAFLVLALFVLAAANPAWCQKAPGSFVSGPHKGYSQPHKHNEVWSRVNASQTWTMLRRDNRTFTAIPERRATLNGIRGTIVAWSGGAPYGGDSDKIFIPDIGSANMRLYYQEFGKTTWNPYYGTMSQIVPLDEGQVASAKQEVARQQAQAQSKSQKQSFIQAIRRGDISESALCYAAIPAWSTPGRQFRSAPTVKRVSRRWGPPSVPTKSRSPGSCYTEALPVNSSTSTSPTRFMEIKKRW